MSTAGSEKKFLLGLLVGAAAGFAAAVWIARRRDRPGGRDVLDQARRLTGREDSSATDSRTERTGRALMRRVDDIRSAGM